MPNTRSFPIPVAREVFWALRTLDALEDIMTRVHEREPNLPITAQARASKLVLCWLEDLVVAHDVDWSPDPARGGAHRCCICEMPCEGFMVTLLMLGGRCHPIYLAVCTACWPRRRPS